MLTGVARRLIGPLISGGGASSGTGRRCGESHLHAAGYYYFWRGDVQVVVDGLFGLKRGDLRSNWEMEQRGGIATAVEEKKSRRRGGTVRAFR